MMHAIRQMFGWKKWYAITFFTQGPNGNGYNRSFCWTYCLDAEQIMAWDREICEMNGFTAVVMINLVPLKNGLGVTIEGQEQK